MSGRDVALDPGAGRPAHGTRLVVPAPADVGRWVRTRWRDLVLASAFAAGVVYVLMLHGFFPGSSPVPLTPLLGSGAVQCLHDQGLSSLWTWCMSLGLPVGAPRMSGVPEIYLAWVLSYWPGLDAWGAHQLVEGSLTVLAFVGAYLLMRRWAVAPWISLLGTVSFLTATNLVRLNGFPYTFTGYLLLPASVYVALLVLDRLDRRQWSRAAAAAALVSSFLVFTDGYAYFAGALLIGCAVLAWARRAWRRRERRVAAAGTLLWVVCLGGAALLYAASIPGDAYSTDVDIEVFALLGVDVATLVVPSATFLIPALAGWAPSVGPLWGLGAGAPPPNYVGLVTAAVVALLLVATRARRDATTSEIRAVGIAGCLALVLSFGPSLKVWQVEPGMSESVMVLPTVWLYENVPGLSEMRATERWFVVTRMALVVLASAGLGALWRRWRGASVRRGVVVVGLAALMTLETAVNVPRVFATRTASIEKVHALDEGIVAEARTMLRPGETVLVLPSVNDFLAGYLVPMTGTRSFNVGGDKNYYLATASWPTDVRVARDAYGPDAQESYGPEAAAAFCAALSSDVDAIVLPYMSPYYGPLLHGEDPVLQERRESAARDFARDPRFASDVGTWLTVLRASDECRRT